MAPEADDPNTDARRAQAALLWLRTAKLVESAWATLDERQIGMQAYSQLRDDSVALLAFTGSAGAVILGLRAMAAVVSPGTLLDADQAPDAPPPAPAAPVAPEPEAAPKWPAETSIWSVRMALLAVQDELGADVDETEIEAWTPAQRAQALAWARAAAARELATPQPGKPDFLP